MKVNNTVLDILGKCRVEDNVLFLPDERLERPDYEAVNKVLTILGGKWNRKAKGHVFDHCPEEEIENVILTGEVTDKVKEYQFFPTPREVAEHLCDLAEIHSDSFVLEPSCGKGNIADVVYERKPGMLYGIELNVDMGKYLQEKPYDTYIGKDFLEFEQCEYWDRIVMNPPFARQQDIDHVYKAFEILKNGGIMVSVMSNSVLFRTNKKTVEFREFLDKHNAVVEELPEGAFKESGTMVRACVVKIVKEV